MKTIRRFFLRFYLFSNGYCWEHLTLACPECRRKEAARANRYIEEIKSF